jgi:hypothetical protein
VPSRYQHAWRPAPLRHESCSQILTSPSWLPQKIQNLPPSHNGCTTTGTGRPPFYPCVIGAAPVPCAPAKLANMQEAAGADITQPQDSSTPQRPLGRRVSAVQRGPHVVNADRHRNASPRQVDRGAPRAESPDATRRCSLTSTSGVCGPWFGKVCAGACRHRAFPITRRSAAGTEDDWSNARNVAVGQWRARRSSSAHLLRI